MPLEARLAFERIRYDPYLEVGPSVAGTRVTGMKMRLVLDHELDGGETGLQTRADLLFPIGTHGSTRLNGLTVTLA